MAGRIRTVKPELFRHELLQDLENQNAVLRPMLVFAGLMTQADRSGRFRWNPRVLKLDILPFVDFDLGASMELLRARGFLRKYEVAGVVYGCFPTWAKHQVINNRERESEIPAPPEGRDTDASCTREARDEDETATPLISAQVEGNGNKEGEQGTEGNKETAPRLTRTRGTRIPEDFAVTEAHRKWAKEQGLPSPDSEVDHFRDYWLAKAGKNAVKLDWDLTFKNWLRNAAQFNSKSGAPSRSPERSHPVEPCRIQPSDNGEAESYFRERALAKRAAGQPLTDLEVNLLRDALTVGAPTGEVASPGL